MESSTRRFGISMRLSRGSGRRDRRGSYAGDASDSAGHRSRSRQALAHWTFWNGLPDAGRHRGPRLRSRQRSRRRAHPRARAFEKWRRGSRAESRHGQRKFRARSHSGGGSGQRKKSAGAAQPAPRWAIRRNSSRTRIWRAKRWGGFQAIRASARSRNTLGNGTRGRASRTTLIFYRRARRGSQRKNRGKTYYAFPVLSG